MKIIENNPLNDDDIVKIVREYILGSLADYCLINRSFAHLWMREREFNYPRIDHYFKNYITNVTMTDESAKYLKQYYPYVTNLHVIGEYIDHKCIKERFNIAAITILFVEKCDRDIVEHISEYTNLQELHVRGVGKWKEVYIRNDNVRKLILHTCKISGIYAPKLTYLDTNSDINRLTLDCHMPLITSLKCKTRVKCNPNNIMFTLHNLRTVEVYSSRAFNEYMLPNWIEHLICKSRYVPSYCDFSFLTNLRTISTRSGIHLKPNALKNLPNLRLISGFDMEEISKSGANICAKIEY